jgi:molybdopterin synthase sulfur carrier subunit
MARVKLFANFREVAGVREVEVKASTVEELLKKLTDLYPKLTDLIFEEGKVRSYVHVMVNGKNIRGLKGLKTEIGEEDTVAIFPPVSGG